MYKCECGCVFSQPKTIYWEDEQCDECPQCKSTNYDEVFVKKIHIPTSSVEDISFNQMLEEVQESWTKEYATQTIQANGTVWDKDYLYKL